MEKLKLINIVNQMFFRTKFMVALLYIIFNVIGALIIFVHFANVLLNTHVFAKYSEINIISWMVFTASSIAIIILTIIMAKITKTQKQVLDTIRRNQTGDNEVLISKISDSMLDSMF
jgi:heme/copper-type cytochrome/quinol oxidase subunit 2